MPDQKKHGLLAQAGLEPYQEKPGEEYMNEAQRAHFKTILETWRNDLRNEVDRTKSHMQDEAANFPDPVDRAAQEEEFGFCESCGIEIGIRRLEARPTADLCVDCKTLAEIKEKQAGRG